ncbi:MAG TPA: TonB-dependent receptor, partial [Epsilonproteobacteria bacterium]|nr:TonB-dependent receptor [Campylobacterota bacterium]
DVNLAYKDDKFTAQLLSAYLSSDSFSALAPRSAEADAYTNKNYNLKLGYMFDENNQLSLSYNRIKTETEYDSTYPTLNPNDSETSSDSDQTNIALTYTFHLENYTATLNASQGQYERGYPYGKYEADLKEYSLINAYKYNNGKVILGLEYKDIDGNPGEAYTNKAIFLSNVYNINEHTLLESNLRYDDFNNFTNKTTYKLGIKHSPDLFDDLTVTANYSTAYDAPSAYQIANVATALGTTQLKPAFTKGYDLSIEYKKLLKLTYFNNKVEDSFDYYSDWDQDYLDGDGYYNAPGTSKFSGLEVESILPLNEIFTLTTNYTHLIKYEKDDGLKFDKRAKDTLNLMLNAYTDNKTYYGINAHYIGDRKEFGNSTGNYTLWNLNFGTNIMEDVDVSIHAKNIFDKDYQSVYGYATEGRSFYANLKYSF